jgi:hypothetical protein
MLAPFDLSEQSASDFVALAIRSRAEVKRQKLFRTACAGDPFLSWLENRTAVLTIFALRLRLRRQQKSRAKALSDQTTKTDRKKSDA